MNSLSFNILTIELFVGLTGKGTVLLEDDSNVDLA